MTENKKQIKANSIKSLTPTGRQDESFFDLVYEIARQIPKGRVTSYGAIAKCIGSGKSARLVGWAMGNSSSIRPLVPAHRVVNSKGLLSGKLAFKTPTEMEELLAREGVVVKDDKVVSFKTKFWNPMEDL
ncbi:MAG TPA: MGMT family protein [Niabella sp.]|nr:MGMT family protein [Niabella sp.]HOZ96506.1 MGMT family protein [Niabella sp.]HQW13313.1 MGMT family protein [Niabella sp.]HQX18647.1 MGMT family protein [Niabella sp.]HQX40300.1 MGMT family protein [Niabella sp.]